MQPDETLEIGPYAITHYRRRGPGLMVAFASAASFGLGEKIEEFRGSLARFGTSMLFVIDRDPRWFDHAHAPAMLAAVAERARAYAQVAALGESMGACGALLFGDWLIPRADHPGLDRILALAPQYSLCDPFIRFDKRFRWFGRAWPEQRHRCFAPARARDRAQLLFGDSDWQDAVHAGMFLAAGFSVQFVAGSNHLVATHLKTATAENRLLALLAAFADFAAPFDAAAVRLVLGAGVAERALVAGL